MATIDGSTWDPWAKRLLLTTENVNAPTYSATPGYPSDVRDVSGALGRGGYEGIQNDSDGNIWIVEDIGGSNKPGTTARIPNSFLYRYVPKHPGDLERGKLQVLQVLNGSGDPITQASQTPLNSPDQLALHTYGSSFKTQWITIHNTATDGNTPFNANALAKAKNGTPFKRPENGDFRPGSDFREFFFDETGDTNATSPENDSAGGWTSVWKLKQKDPSAGHGRISIFYKGDQAHAGFDNSTFLSKNLITFVEDAGDTLHGAAERARLRLRARRHARLLEAVEPASPVAGRGPRRVRHDRLRERRLRQERGRQRGHGRLRLRRRSVGTRDPRSGGAEAVP